MKISEVMKITSLTKKAINYYEENGLISPSIKDNNYRDYSEADIEKLKQISVLRSFDISVKKIKEILLKPKEMGEILEEHLNNIKLKIANMKRSEEIIEICMKEVNSKVPNVQKITDNMILLKESLEMSEKEKKGYMKRELMRIFPGFFGRYICLKFSNYLDEPIDSKEKENAWIHLVKVLDSSNTLRVKNETIEDDEIDWKLFEKIIQNKDEKFFKMTDGDIKSYVKNLYNLEFTEMDLKFFEKFISCMDSKESIKYTNDLLQSISGDLKILSLKYKKFEENRLKVNDEMKKVHSNLMEFDYNKVKNSMGVITLPQMTFVAYEYTKFIPFGKTAKLVDTFRSRIKEIKNVINPNDIYTINGIDSLPEYEKPKTNKFTFSFIIGVQVSSVEGIPDDMKVFTIPQHKHAWYIKQSKNLKAFIKGEIPMIRFISKSYEIVKFPVISMYRRDYNDVDAETIVFNYMPITEKN